MSTMSQADVFRKQRDFAERKVEELPAKIDSLMLEYCPDEMTEAQIKNWGKHQVKSDVRI